MIYRKDTNTELFIENLTTVSTVIKEDKEHVEPKARAVFIPKLQTLSPDFNMDMNAHINLLSEDELESLYALAATHRNALDMAMLVAPTDYNDKSFHYNGKYIARSDCYYYTKVNYFLYNRLKIIHSLLENHGIVTVLVTEPFLLATKQLLDEIFGKNNAITTHIVVHNKAGNCKNGVLQQHQYVLVYAKSKQLAIEETAYNVSEMTQFCIEKRGIFATSEDLSTEKVERKYKDAISTFDVVSNIRPQKRRKNDNNYYPIYYIPGNTSENGFDETPRLYLEPTGHPEEYTLYPINENGEDRVWNTIPATFMRNYKASSYWVKMQNGKPKLYYKIRDNVSENNYVLEPVKTVLDEYMSNLTTSKKISKLMGDKDQYIGYNPNLTYYLMSAYSKEGSKVLAVNDRCLSVYIATLENQVNRTIFTPINTNLTDTNKYLSALLAEYQHQFLNFTLEAVPDSSMLEFVEEVKDKQEGLATLIYGGMAQLENTSKYAIYETKNYDIVILMKTRYDLEVYLSLKEKIATLGAQEYANFYIYFIDDSTYCQGQDIIQSATFINLIQDYKFTYNTLVNKTLVRYI